MWQLRLGLTQVAILIGVVCGSLVCAFAVGYISGQKVGFENALNSSVASLPRYPIEGTSAVEPAQEQVKEVYADLKEEPAEQVPDQPEKEAELPKLAAVKEVTNSPLVDDLVVDLLDEQPAQPTEQLGDTKPIEEDMIDQLTEDLLADGQKPEEPVAGAEVDLAAGKANAVVTDTEQSTTAVKEAEVPSASPQPSPSARPVESGFLKAKLQPGWYVQIAAPESLTEANKLAGNLRESGFPVSVEKAMVRNQNYYRVLVGPEDNSAQGERLLQQVRREKAVMGQPFLRMVR